ncbi:MULTISPECIES: hypothetical protein [unclassified Micromonospora]|uniref:DUF6966 domain-containing protein n=1 Tax=unclassified Micromonospora TaxID=2617518 RepID=UPI001034123B|nr:MULTISPECIES: hypothetical protein [unclassified Micromonospora]QKW11408.1 hypothetical protein HUT12_00465 [Verrucosispora sp. NA02020]TBL42247.1 hypothetical protein EYA84_04365 [Verrucosispora sp. SN26_14.1]
MVKVPQSRIDWNLQRFRIALVDLRDLLRQADTEHWAQWADRALTRLDAGDVTGLDYWMDAYGGMGSISDLSIIGSGSLSPDRERAVSEQIEELRGLCYGLAAQLKADIQESRQQ